MATITKRGSSYRIRVSCGYDINGVQIMKSTTWTPEPGMTAKQIEKELERQKVLFEEKCKTGQMLDGNIRFADFAEKWFKDYAEKQLRARTLERYKILMKRITPAIGHIKLDQLKPHHLSSFFDNLSESGIADNQNCLCKDDLKEVLKSRGITKESFAKTAGIGHATLDNVCKQKSVSFATAERVAKALDLPMDQIFKPTTPDRQLADSTIKYYYTLINSILNKAVKWNIIFDNPCRRIDPPKVKRKEMRFFEEDDVASLLQHLQEESPQNQAMIMLLLNLGLRRGELLGIEWKDIDWKNGSVSICRASAYTPQKGIYTEELKTISGYRTIKLSASVVQELRAYQAWQNEQRLKVGDLWHVTDRLFVRWNGLPVHPDSPGDWWRKFLTRNKLPYVPIHGLRHTNASFMIASGINIRTVAGRLGHARPSHSSDIYGHFIKSADAVAAEALDDLLIGLQGKNIPAKKKA